MKPNIQLVHGQSQGPSESPALAEFDSEIPDDSDRLKVFSKLSLLCLEAGVRRTPGAPVAHEAVEVRDIGDGIWELRVRSRRGRYRVLYEIDGQCDLVLVLLVYRKQTQELPPQKLRRARARRDAWHAWHVHKFSLL